MDLNVYFMMQETLQKKMFGYEVPTDSVESFKYSILSLVGEIGEEVIEKYAGEYALELTVSDYLDVLAVTENFTAEQEYKLEVIEYLREHLKFMDVSYFVDTVFSIYSEYVKGQ
jgi:hypothetical protein